MDQELIFRLLILAGFLLILPFGVYFRLKSQSTRESLDRRAEGIFILATLRPIALLHSIGTIMYLLNPRWMAWSSLGDMGSGLLPDWSRWSGVAFGLAGISLFVWTLKTLGPNLTDTVVTRQKHELVTGGPYRWVRHPFYGAAALVVIAIAVLSANWFLALTGGSVLGLLVKRTDTEEAKLLERFGEEYREYALCTGRFLPRRRRSDRS